MTYKETVIDIGPEVCCDLCNEDYTGKPDSGGILFGSYAACPRCAPKIERDAKADGEERYIKARCPKGKSYAEWVLWLRNGDNTVTIREWNP